VNKKLQKRIPGTLKENVQYGLAFGVIAVMLFAVGFPAFVIFFFGIFAYFLWKTFSSPALGDTREIFEFYLSANEILRDDERRWFGFEVQEVVGKGEHILEFMNTAPPLVYFTLGALYNKTGDHKSAVNHLAYIIENENSRESTYNSPSPDLMNYVRILRKIEREPAEAPQMSAAIRALERARRNRGKILLENSRLELKEQNRKKREATLELKKRKNELARSHGENALMTTVTDEGAENAGHRDIPLTEALNRRNGKNKPTKREAYNDDPFANRKPITEVLHDIYDDR
jgi:hypothetical protein